MTWSILTGEASEVLATLPADSVQCVVTSPPYYGLRDYGVEGQLGLEPTLGEYVERLVAIMAEVRRVLRPDGTLWLNLGDSYAAKPRGEDGSWDPKRLTNPGRSQKEQAMRRSRRSSSSAGVKEKDLMMVPATVALALRADGWWLRSEIIWHKLAPMPESVADRPTRAHEQVYLLSKAKSYFYDAAAVREADKGTDHARTVLDGQPSLEPTNGLRPPHRGLRTIEGRDGLGRNKRTVWTLAGTPFPGAHFATFPPALVEPCLLAGSRPGDLVLDPFAGSGTVLMVAERLGRDSIGVELNPEYAALARRRVIADCPLHNEAAEGPAKLTPTSEAAA